MSREPQVLFAMMTGTGLVISEDDGSMFIANIGNGIDVAIDGDDYDGRSVLDVPFFVIASAGEAGIDVTLTLEAEYPDGSRLAIPVEGATKQSRTEHGILPWRAGVRLPFRMLGVHWLHVSINGELKTSSPLNVRRSKQAIEADALGQADFQA